MRSNCHYRHQKVGRCRQLMVKTLLPACHLVPLLNNISPHFFFETLKRSSQGVLSFQGIALVEAFKPNGRLSVSLSRIIKCSVFCGSLAAALLWVAAGTASQTTKLGPIKQVSYAPGDYIGSDACKDCHEDQF